MELNPEHPTVSTLHDHWHKIVALILYKLKLTEVRITQQDVKDLEKKWATEMPCVVCEEVGEVLSIRMISESDAKQLLSKQKSRN